jgi:ribonuclease P/MRP protein subunit RPP1
MSIFECNLHAIPEGSDSASRLAFAAKRLGYDGIIISNHSCFIDIFRPRAAFEIKSIDVNFGIEIVGTNPKALRNWISKMRSRYAFIAIHGGSENINRAACEHPEVDVLLHPEEGRRVLSIAAARAAEHNQVAIGFDLSPLIRLRGITRARWIELIKRNIILARKFDLQIMITTGPKSHFDMRTPQELGALAEITGFESSEIEAALNLPGKILELNKKIWLSTGVELL